MKDNFALSGFKDALQGSGLNAGLILLNKRVAHRFTAVYRLDNGIMRNVAVVDKQGEVVPQSLLEVPLEHSFCQFVLKDGSFMTQNSADEGRLQGHIYKGVLNSYVGLPLTTNNGDLFGTFCHFDFPPQEIVDEEFEFLQTAVRLLPAYVIS